MSLKSAAALSMVALFAAAGAARADIVHFAATLTGKDEVPPNSSAGTGQVTAELETSERTLAYRATYQGCPARPPWPTSTARPLPAPTALR